MEAALRELREVWDSKVGLPAMELAIAKVEAAHKEGRKS